MILSSVGGLGYDDMHSVTDYKEGKPKESKVKKKGGCEMKKEQWKQEFGFWSRREIRVWRDITGFHVASAYGRTFVVFLHT